MAVALVSLAVALLPGAAVMPRAPGLLSCRRSVAISAQAVEEPKIESACGFDFVPLLTALQAGEFREADQLTRDALITMAGTAAVTRGYVYFTEAPKIPKEDMATLERLWSTYSEGKFGYAVQAAAYNSKKVNKNLVKLYERIGWSHPDGKLLRWLPEAKNDEFIYDLDKAPKGHLPLTSTLRGTQLLTGLLEHEAWGMEGESCFDTEAPSSAPICIPHRFWVPTL
jgi:hypothetical protein